MMRVEPQYNVGQRDWQNLFALTSFCYTMEPRYRNEPLYNAVLGIKNDFLYPSKSKIIMKKSPDVTKPFVMESFHFIEVLFQIQFPSLLSLGLKKIVLYTEEFSIWRFVISRSHCIERAACFLQCCSLYIVNSSIFVNIIGTKYVSLLQKLPRFE